MNYSKTIRIVECIVYQRDLLFAFAPIEAKIKSVVTLRFFTNNVFGLPSFVRLKTNSPNNFN